MASQSRLLWPRLLQADKDWHETILTARAARWKNVRFFKIVSLLKSRFWLRSCRQCCSFSFQILHCPWFFHLWDFEGRSCRLGLSHRGPSPSPPDEEVLMPWIKRIPRGRDKMGCCVVHSLFKSYIRMDTWLDLLLDCSPERGWVFTEFSHAFFWSDIRSAEMLCLTRFAWLAHQGWNGPRRRMAMVQVTWQALRQDDFFFSCNACTYWIDYIIVFIFVIL